MPPMERMQLTRAALSGLEALVWDARFTLNAEMDQLESVLGLAMEALVDDEVDEVGMSLYNRGTLSRPHVAWLVMNHAWKGLLDNTDVEFTCMAFLPPDEGPACPDAEEKLAEMADVNFENTTHPCGIIGVFAFWIYTGEIWVDEAAGGVQQGVISVPPMTNQRRSSAPASVSEGTDLAEDVFGRWRRAWGEIREETTAANFVKLWHEAERVLMQGGRPGMLEVPEHLPRLLGWIGFGLGGSALRRADGELANGPEHATTPTPARPVTTRARISDQHLDMVAEITQTYSEVIMWECLRSQQVNLFGTIDDDGVPISDTESE
ncbi:hypothetical protein F4818DRAFT_443047 [Hypoxylon cercidicola]|nr:hypothetical protein F4818DRAFT_443047 [Hypoxylon cercidicola]